MTPGARLKTALELCYDIDSEEAPTESVLQSFFRRRRYAGARDRRSISNQIYTILRHKSGLDWWIETVQSEQKSPTQIETRARARLISTLVLFDKASMEDLDRLFSGNRHCPTPLSEQERSLASALQGHEFVHPKMPNWVLYEYPDWLDGSFRRLWRDDLARQLDALNQPAQLDLRVNTLRSSRDEVHKALVEAGLSGENTPLSPVGVRLSGRVKLSNLKLYRDGLIEVQDEGSQLVSLLADARPGMRVVDFCAGGGGKTLALAACMGENGRVQGRLIACDVSDHRLDKAQQRLKRAKIGPNVVGQSLAGANIGWIDKNQGLAERVLIDVPCTGSGVWRRKPESKWRLTPEGLEQLRQEQRSIMLSARKLVKEGGRLIYVTCSVLTEENEDQITWFLENAPEFDLHPISEVWPNTVGGTCPAREAWLRLTPADHGTDGFFCAIVKRRDDRKSV